MSLEVNPATGEPDEEEALQAAQLALYRFLALATSDPRSRRWEALEGADLCEGARLAAEFLAARARELGQALAPGELLPEHLDLAPILVFLGRLSRQELTEAHDGIFSLVVSKECPPYETEYCPQTFSVSRSHHLADVAGFYRAFAVEPSRDRPERQDHVSLELEFMAWLLAKERRAEHEGGPMARERAAVCREARVLFFKEHLVWWLPAFALALRKKASGTRQEEQAPPQGRPASFHEALARVLGAFVGVERTLLGLAPPAKLLAPRIDPAAPEGPESKEGCAGCPEAQTC